MKRTSILVALAVGIVSLVAACSTPSATTSADGKGTVRMLDPKDALSLIEKNKGNDRFMILDVRTLEEFDGGHIPGAVNINFESPLFKSEIDKLDRTKTYLVYCRTGRRSSAAAKAMVGLGFTDIYRISGDIVKWQSLGLPLAK
jgi:rhodanese-related sulfurtransferase